MATRIAHQEYTRSSGARVTLIVNRYENEPDFQAFSISRYVNPHDPAFATFAGFDIRSELEDLLAADLADTGSPEYAPVRDAVLVAFDKGEEV